MRPMLAELADLARSLRTISSRLDAVLALAKGRESANVSGMEQLSGVAPLVKDGAEGPSESEYSEVF